MRQLAIYLHLARGAKIRLQSQSQVRFLLLAAIVAFQLKLPRIVAACRAMMLEVNPHHMVRRWASIETALDDPDFRHFLRQVERRYPPEKAEQLLTQLGIDMANEQRLYASHEEYAASLLGVTEMQLREFDQR